MPHTVAYVVRMRETIDSFMELPKEKRPPESIWFDGDELTEWFDRVFDRNRQATFDLYIDEVEG